MTQGNSVAQRIARPRAIPPMTAPTYAPAQIVNAQSAIAWGCQRMRGTVAPSDPIRKSASVRHAEGGL